MSDSTDTRAGREAAALVHELDRLIASARDHEAESARVGDSRGDGREPARLERERARQLRESAETTRSRALALSAETRALVDQAHCAGIEWREWPRSTAQASELVDDGATPHPASVPHVTPAQHPALARAIRYVEEHAGEPIGVADIVRAAGVGTRHLQGLFRHDHQVTPMGYLRRVRLDLAHADLRRADPTLGHTVEDVARRWQFTHLGRFASAYRERFGCVPSRTLRALPAEPSAG